MSTTSMSRRLRTRIDDPDVSKRRVQANPPAFAERSSAVERVSDLHFIIAQTEGGAKIFVE